MNRVLATMVLLGLTVGSQADVLYVDADAAGGNDGTSWTDAFRNLQAAIAISSAGDEIWVAAGTYKPTATTTRTISFVLKQGVAVYGGFAGTETQKDERDPEVHVTVLSGDIGATGDSSDNSLHVVRAGIGLTASSVLDGFTITAGHADGSGNDGSGGGMWVSGGTPILARLRLVSNMATDEGGGLAITGGSPVLTDFSALSNSGASAVWATSVTCTGCIVRSNGGDGISASSTTLVNTIVAGNGGRGVFVRFPSTLRNCTIAGNSLAGLFLGGIFPPLGEVSLATSVSNTIFWGNLAGITVQPSVPAPAVTYSDVQGDSVYAGTGNINADPLFRASPGDLRVEPGSPVVDAGANDWTPYGLTTDVAGLLRFTDDSETPDTGAGTRPIVDMGAHEKAGISAQPLSLSACLGENAHFSVTASGVEPLTYQWRRDQTPLSNGGRVSGADTDTLTIDDAIPGDSGVYDVLVTDGEGESFGSANAELEAGEDVRNPVVTAPASLPSGSIGDASVPAESGTAFTWTVTGGTITAGQGTSAITFTAGDAGTGMLLSVTDPSWSCPTPNASIFVPIDFLDVPGDDIFHDFVTTVVHAGLTVGCGGGLYCRDQPVTRAQMAVFLLKAKYGPEYAPPPCGGVFLDVPCPSLFADWVEQLAAEGITAGCAGGHYCPGQPVLRQQMAVFLLRTKFGNNYPPPVCTGLFEDVPCPTTFANWIEDLSNRGITGGCSVSPRLFCPISSVTRGQMAVFLTKAFDLPRP